MDSKPWKDILIDTRDYTVYRDKYPVTEGHLLFVPKEQTFEAIQKCYKAAYGWGYEWVEKGYCDAYNCWTKCRQGSRSNCSLSTYPSHPTSQG